MRLLLRLRIMRSLGCAPPVLLLLLLLLLLVVGSRWCGCSSRRPLCDDADGCCFMLFGLIEKV